MMLLGTGLETGFRLFGGVFACTVVRLIGNAQQVLCVVAEKAGCPAAGAFDGRGQKVLHRKQKNSVNMEGHLHFFTQNFVEQLPMHMKKKSGIIQ